MTKSITPELTHEIYMTIERTDIMDWMVSPERAADYASGIKSLLMERGSNRARLDALLNRLGEKSCIRLFVMPEKPFAVPATFIKQTQAGFDRFFDVMRDEFQVRHLIFYNGLKYSRRPEDDSEVTIFLERKAA